MLGDVSPGRLAEIVADSMGTPAIPQLYDEGVRRRAMAIAARQGLFERIEAELADDRPIPVLPFSLYREFRHTGRRDNWSRAQNWRRRQVELAAMAVYLGVHEKAPYLQDLLWAECETDWWLRPAHEAPNCPVDIFVADRAFRYALTAIVLARSIGTPAMEVADRTIAEVRRRVLDEYLRPGRLYWWKHAANNWNVGANGAIGLAAMLVETDPDRLTRILRSVLRSLPAFLSSFTDDGGCSEGPGYTCGAIGSYVRFAAALHDFTGGRVNIMAGERMQRICRFPLAMSVAPGQQLIFADMFERGYFSLATAATINRFRELPELFGLCRPAEDGSIRVDSLMDLLGYDGREYSAPTDRRDYHLPDLGAAKVRCGDVTVGVKAGHNGEYHNHNDVGSFLVHRGGTFFLTDPGGPVYTRKTFGPERYESVFCNSRGHSVPVINGRGQGAGGGFAGSMQADGLNADGARSITVEMAGAYDVASLERLRRVIEIPPAGGAISLADTFGFTCAPESLEEVFITTLPAEVAADGHSVTIRSETDGSAELVAVRTPGRFEVAELAAESAASRTGQLLRRITFTPAELTDTMTLKFTVRLCDRA